LKKPGVAKGALGTPAKNKHNMKLKAPTTVQQMLLPLLMVITTSIPGFFTSCKSTRKIQSAIEKKDTTVTVKVDPGKDDSIKFVSETIKKFKAGHIGYRTFSAKVKIEYEDSKESLPDFTAFIRMAKDSLIWIRIEALFGIEVFRVLITPDSVYVLDKFKKRAMTRSLDYIEEIAELPLDFSTLQDLVVGNPVFFGENITSLQKNERVISLLHIGEIFKHLVTLDNATLRMQHSKLDDVDINRNRTADLNYNDYEEKNGIQFSTERNVVIAEKSRVEIKMHFKQFQFNEMLNYPFNIPSSYKKQ
jgi:predicted DNA binding protein